MRPAVQHTRSFLATLIASTLIIGTTSPSIAQVGVATQCQLLHVARAAVVLKLSAMSVAQALEQERTQGPGKYQLFAWAAAATSAARSQDTRQSSASSLARLQIDAHAARARGPTGEFERAMSLRLQDSTLSSDDRAYCMLALAYDQEIASAKPAPLAGKQWIDRALAVAESDAVRQDCLEYLVIRHVWARSFVEAKSIVLGSEASFMTDPNRMTVLMIWASEHAVRSGTR